MLSTFIIVPSFNEAGRLPGDAFLSFLDRHPGIRFLFVNDGSTDETEELLLGLKDRAPDGVEILALHRNQGKAEAVRQGCLAAFAAGADAIGYWDADLATPLEAIPDFLDVLDEHPHIDLVCGSRLPLLGRSIQRSWLRQRLGRVFATAASCTLGLSIQDTQCGAKLFRASNSMQAVFMQPFSTRWLLDVEILARLIAVGNTGLAAPAHEVIYELPLRRWCDIAGSKVKAFDFPKAILELWAIHRRYLRAGAPWQPILVQARSSARPVYAHQAV